MGCKESKCGRPIRAVNLCGKHYQQKIKSGELVTKKFPRLSIGEMLRQWSNHNELTGCREWTHRINSNGYGVMPGEGKGRGAHRIAYERAYGSIPHGMLVCHKCDNRKCLNVAHLFLGTPADNASDRNKKQRTARGERSGSTKLSWQDVCNIRETYSRGDISFRELGRRYNVAHRTIREIVSYERWKVAG